MGRHKEAAGLVEDGPWGWSVELGVLYWTIFWWSCLIGRGDGSGTLKREVRAEGVGPRKRLLEKTTLMTP